MSSERSLLEDRYNLQNLKILVPFKKLKLNCTNMIKKIVNFQGIKLTYKNACM